MKFRGGHLGWQIRFQGSHYCIVFLYWTFAANLTRNSSHYTGNHTVLGTGRKSLVPERFSIHLITFCTSVALAVAFTWFVIRPILTKFYFHFNICKNAQISEKYVLEPSSYGKNYKSCLKKSEFVVKSLHTHFMCLLFNKYSRSHTTVSCVTVYDKKHNYRAQ